MLYTEELDQTYRRLAARARAANIELGEDYDMAELVVRIVGLGFKLGVEHPYMLVLYPESFIQIMRNDYRAFEDVTHVPEVFGEIT